MKIEYKNRADRGELSFLGWRNQKPYVLPVKERSRLCIGVPEWRRSHEPCGPLEVSTSPVFAYLRRKFFGEREPGSSTIRRHLHRARHCVMVLMVFLARPFTPLELDIQNLPVHNARMWVGVYRGILFSLAQSVHDFVRGIEVQELAEGT